MSHKRRSDPAPEVELPITPMLDMAFQLLTFFIFTYHPSAMEGQMDLSLPASGQIAGPTAVADSNPDPEPEFKETYTIKLHARLDSGEAEGSLSNWSIVGLAQIDGDDMNSLHAALEKMRVANAPPGEEKKTGEDKDAGKTIISVKLQAAASLKWRYVVEVMDRCKQMGFANVGFAAPLD